MKKPNYEAEFDDASWSLAYDHFILDAARCPEGALYSPAGAHREKEMTMHLLAQDRRARGEDLFSVMRSVELGEKPPGHLASVHHGATARYAEHMDRFRRWNNLANGPPT